MAFALVVAVGWFVTVARFFSANVLTERISEECGVHGWQVCFVNGGGIKVIGGVKSLLKVIVHGVNSNFAVVVSGDGIKVGFLDKEGYGGDAEYDNNDD